MENNRKPLGMNKDEYHSLIQQLPDIIYKINEKGRFTFLNDSIAMLGYTPRDLLGKHFSAIIHKDYIDLVSREKVLQKYKNKKTGDNESPPLFDERRTGKRGTKNLELQLLHKQNKEKKKPVGGIYTIINSEGLWETDKKSGKKIFVGSIGIIRNITNIKKREDKVLYLHTLLKVVKKLQNVCSRENDFKKIGQSLCEILGQSKLYKGVRFAFLDDKINRIIPLDYNSISLHMRWSVSPGGIGDAPLCIRETLESGQPGMFVWKENMCGDCEYCGYKNSYKVMTLKISSSYKQDSLNTTSPETAIGTQRMLSTTSPETTTGTQRMLSTTSPETTTGTQRMLSTCQHKIIGILLIFVENKKIIYEEEQTLLEEIASCIASVYNRIKADAVLKEREQRYRNLIENLNEGVWVIDKVYNTSFVNKKMAVMLQYTPEELTGKSILKFINGRDKRNFWIYLKQCIMGIKKQYDCRFNCKGGKKIYALIAGTVLVDDNGIYDGLILGIVNITKRKQIEKSLIKKNKMLNRFNNIAVHRELKMIELKKEINTLLVKLEKESKYCV